MKKNQWLLSIMALTTVLVWGSVDFASAQPYGRGQGAGRGVCVQTPADQTGAPAYRQGQGRRAGQGQGQQLRRRDGSCLNTPNTPAPPNNPPSN